MVGAASCDRRTDEIFGIQTSFRTNKLQVEIELESNEIEMKRNEIEIELKQNRIIAHGMNGIKTTRPLANIERKDKTIELTNTTQQQTHEETMIVLLFLASSFLAELRTEYQRYCIFAATIAMTSLAIPLLSILSLSENSTDHKIATNAWIQRRRETQDIIGVRFANAKSLQQEMISREYCMQGLLDDVAERIIDESLRDAGNV
jgi:hypothetical protein